MTVRPLWRIPLIVARERRHPAGRERIPEPMVMDDVESVAQFHEGGASNPGQIAVYDFSARALDALLPENARLLDLGVGSGRALTALLRRRPDIKATAVDLAPNMLATARTLLVAEGLADRVELVEADITALPDRLADSDWDGVSCVWTLHQLPDFDVMRGALRQISALRRSTGAAVWIFDFQRLNDRPRSRRSSPVWILRCRLYCSRMRWQAKLPDSRTLNFRPSWPAPDWME
jgi:tRNA (cmo5U34)-methyltransferase